MNSGMSIPPVIVLFVIFVSAENVDPSGKDTFVMSVFSLIMPSSFQPSREKRKSPSTGLAVDAGRGLEVLQVLAALFPANRSFNQSSTCGAA